MKISNITGFVTEKAQQASKSVTAFVESDGTKAAIQRTKDTISATKDGAVDLGKRTAHSVNTFVESEDTKATIAFAKKTAVGAAEEAMELGKRAKNSEMGKDILTGAGIGALVAVPVPVVGPIAGALVGGALGMATNLKKGDSKKPAATESKPSPATYEVDIHKRLTELDDLRQKGLLSQEEFDAQKKKLLIQV